MQEGIINFTLTYRELYKKIEDEAHSGLIDLITLEDEKTPLKGQNFKTTWGRVFGGGCCPSLSIRISDRADDRFAHSLHGYFILGGNLELPITYRSTSSETVKALLPGGW